MANLVGASIKYGKKLSWIPMLPKLIRMVNRIVLSCDIPVETDIDESVIFAHHGLGVVVNSKASIGAGSKILQNVTIGGTGHKRIIGGEIKVAPIVGRNVLLGSGSQIIGPIIIGDNVIIASGAVVTKDIEANTVVAGVPAKKIKDLSPPADLKKK